jgi:hypothetical protein
VPVEKVEWAILPSEFVGTREPFCATRESTSMGLLSSVSTDVTSLVLKTVEGLVTERALVRPGQVLSRLVVSLLRGILQQRSHEAHGSSSHGCVGVWCGTVLLLFSRCLGVE